jgi:hypothetical protein
MPHQGPSRCRVPDFLSRAGVIPIGRRYAKKTIDQAAHACEQALDWRTQ